MSNPICENEGNCRACQARKAAMEAERCPACGSTKIEPQGSCAACDHCGKWFELQEQPESTWVIKTQSDGIAQLLIGLRDVLEADNDPTRLHNAAGLNTLIELREICTGMLMAQACRRRLLDHTIGDAVAQLRRHIADGASFGKEGDAVPF